MAKLAESFTKTKTFCDQRELIINTSKTQFIIFKSPRRKLLEGIEIVLDGIAIQPSPHVKLLGLTLDRHLTFGEHLDLITRKCNGTIGMLARAAPRLPRDLLRTAYVAMIRTHLEYASAAFFSASKTQLAKLDVVQRKAARVICRAPRDSHAEPLLALLQLEPLEVRRKAHVVKIIDAILDKNSHPTLESFFPLNPDGSVTNDSSTRTSTGKKRFSIAERDVFNNNLQALTRVLGHHELRG